MGIESQWQNRPQLRSPLTARPIVHPTRATPAPAPAYRPTLDHVVAVVGCDGSGKTTLTADLLTCLRRTQYTERHYMGLISGEFGERVKKWPLVGPHIERRFAAKARKTQTMRNKLPGTFASIVMYLFSLWRVSKVRRMMRVSQSGTLVVADRYPQAEIPGFDYDGPGLSLERSHNWLTRTLAAREQRMYEWMAEQRPNLIIRLNVDPATAMARKADHPEQELRDKSETMPRITYNGTRICDIDTRQPYPKVLEAALRAVREVLGEPIEAIPAA